jgi:tRNA threonylcarbamoyl adenosine modification protein (Sua5/YciO/YrdC/YwlC family)
MVVAIPTDTVYGLAVDPMQRGAVERLFALKERPLDVALPLMVGGTEQVEMAAGSLDTAARKLADRFWPGPLTLVVPRATGFSVDLGGPSSARRTVGIRWPAHALVQLLCAEVGPLAVTSANLHGQAPATSAEGLSKSFAGHKGPALVLDGGVCDGTPSTVVECRGPASRCLREGAISRNELLHASRRAHNDIAEGLSRS